MTTMSVGRAPRFLAWVLGPGNTAVTQTDVPALTLADTDHWGDCGRPLGDTASQSLGPLLLVYPSLVFLSVLNVHLHELLRLPPSVRGSYIPTGPPLTSLF